MDCASTFNTPGRPRIALGTARTWSSLSSSGVSILIRLGRLLEGESRACRRRSRPRAQHRASLLRNARGRDAHRERPRFRVFGNGSSGRRDRERRVGFERRSTSMKGCKKESEGLNKLARTDRSFVQDPVSEISHTPSVMSYRVRGRIPAPSHFIAARARARARRTLLPPHHPTSEMGKKTLEELEAERLALMQEAYDDKNRMLKQSQFQELLELQTDESRSSWRRSWRCSWTTRSDARGAGGAIRGGPRDVHRLRQGQGRAAQAQGSSSTFGADGVQQKCEELREHCIGEDPSKCRTGEGSLAELRERVDELAAFLARYTAKTKEIQEAKAAAS